MEICDFYSHAGRCDGTLRGIMVSHSGDVTNSDAFIFVLNCRVLLLDGGMKGCTDARDRLMKLRENIAPGGKLRITWVVSHYQVDHVAAAIESILPETDAFEIDDVYLPPSSGLDGVYAEYSDAKWVRRVRAAIAQYHPEATVHRLAFVEDGGFRDFFEYAGAKVTLMPPEANWSSKYLIDSIIKNGCYGDAATDKQLATYIIKSTSMWMKISYAGKRLLFTGDSMKLTNKFSEESFDLMLKMWRHYFERADLVKWPHHGIKRDCAAAGMLSIRPKYILTSTQEETASAYAAEHFPREAAKVQFVNCASQDVYLKIAPDGDFEVQ